METKTKSPNRTAMTVYEIFQQISIEQGSTTILHTNGMIAKQINRGPREVQRAVLALQEAGLLTVDIDNLRQPVRIIRLVTNAN
jgi:predicted transcriptional regulator